MGKNNTISGLDSSLVNDSHISGDTGSITKIIGSGENAKNSITYFTIKYSFIAMGVIIAIFTIISMTSPKVINNFIGGVRTITSIFLPIITLSLGYLFGRHSDKIK